MKRIYEITTLDIAENPIERFELMAVSAADAYEQTLEIIKEEIPEWLWIAPKDDNWFIKLQKKSAFVN
jgi:hypothetical protein